MIDITLVDINTEKTEGIKDAIWDAIEKIAGAGQLLHHTNIALPHFLYERAANSSNVGSRMSGTIRVKLIHGVK